MLEQGILNVGDHFKTQILEWLSAMKWVEHLCRQGSSRLPVCDSLVQVSEIPTPTCLLFTGLWFVLWLRLAEFAMPPSSVAPSDGLPAPGSPARSLQELAAGPAEKVKLVIKLCKYCRNKSSDHSPLPPGCFPIWDPYMPWNDGTKSKPRGLVCRICIVVSWRLFGCYWPWVLWYLFSVMSK